MKQAEPAPESRIRSSVLISTLRIAQLGIGLVLYGIGIALMLRANLGTGPWDVLNQGISRQTGLSFGIVTIAIGAVVLLLWIPIRQKPGWGTLANAVLVGIFADITLAILPLFTDVLLQLFMLILGIFTVGIATGLYIGVNMGPGPRDGLMTGLHARTGSPLWVVRTGLELTVLALGWLLGGTIGIGTVAFALFIGPLVNWTIPLFSLKIYQRPKVA